MTEANSPTPFDDIRKLVASFPAPDNTVSINPDASSDLSQIISWLSTWQGAAPPQVKEPLIAIYVSTYGLALSRGEEATSAKSNLAAMQSGKADLNALAGEIGAGLRAFDLALELPSPDVSQTPSFSERDCAATIAFGMEAVANQTDVLVLGDAGVGTDLSAALVGAVLFGGEITQWSFRGSLSGGDLTALESARTRGGAREDPLESIAEYGSREIAAQLGALIACRIQQIPVLLDGPSACVAALALDKLIGGGADHCWFAAVGQGPGAQQILRRAARKPLISMEETASDAVLTLGLLRDACEKSDSLAQ
jgi:nicotinate-nucleotide--dimethylbenzimidazole phosphoribosyltransferase